MRASRRLTIRGVMVPFLLGVILLWTSQSYSAERFHPPTHAASCRESRLSASWTSKGATRHLRLEVDVDGDGRSDLLEAESSSGSGFSGTVVHVTLRGSGTQLKAEESFDFTRITAVSPVPKELLNPRHRDPLAWIEEAIFDRICTTPDPSLAWLLKSTKRLTWIEGPPEMPGAYTIRLPARSLPGPLRVASVPPVSGGEFNLDGEVWLFYAGGVHTMNAYKVVELARKGDRVLLGTAHGVILTDPERSKHVWIYVYPGDGEVKLRRPSIAGARLEGETAIITLDTPSLDRDNPRLGGKAAKPLQVRINLKTGSIAKY